MSADQKTIELRGSILIDHVSLCCVDLEHVVAVYLEGHYGQPHLQKIKLQLQNASVQLTGGEPKYNEVWTYWVSKPWRHQSSKQIQKGTNDNAVTTNAKGAP